MSHKIVMPPQPGGSGIAARIDAVTRIPITHRTTGPPPPRSVKIELTSQSNGDMAWPLYTRLVGEMVDAGVEELGLFFIAEAFICDWLPDAIAHAKARGMRYAFVTTNGSLARPERVRACLDAGLDSLKFSMNDASLHPDAIANLKAARRVRDEGNYACGIYACSLRDDGEQQQRMQALVAQILPYVDEHYWLPRRHALPCWSVFTEGHITRDGKLSACCFDAGEGWLADLKEVSFLDGWSSAAFARLREAHLKREVKGTLCERCADLV